MTMLSFVGYCSPRLIVVAIRENPENQLSDTVNVHKMLRNQMKYKRFHDFSSSVGPMLAFLTVIRDPWKIER